MRFWSSQYWLASQLIFIRSFPHSVRPSRAELEFCPLIPFGVPLLPFAELFVVLLVSPLSPAVSEGPHAAIIKESAATPRPFQSIFVVIILLLRLQELVHYLNPTPIQGHVAAPPREARSG